MITIKNEGFSESFPGWLVKALEKGDYYGKDGSNRNRKANIAWDTAKYIPAELPSSARSADFKDPNRLPVYRIKTDYNSTGVYIPGLLDPNVYDDAFGPNNNGWHSVKASALSYKNLASITIEYGYIDKSKDSTTDKKKDRENARKDSVERNPKMGQNWSEYSQKWLTTRGYDKSGYKLNPDKYINMLANMDVNDTEKASRRIEMYYNQIEDIKSKIVKELSASSKDLANKSGKGSFSRSKFGDLSDALEYLNRAIEDYKSLLKSIEDLKKNTSNMDDEKSKESYRRWISYDLKRNGEEIKDYLKKARELLD